MRVLGAGCELAEVILMEEATVRSGCGYVWGQQGKRVVSVVEIKTIE